MDIMKHQPIMSQKFAITMVVVHGPLMAFIVSAMRLGATINLFVAGSRLNRVVIQFNIFFLTKKQSCEIM